MSLQVYYTPRFEETLQSAYDFIESKFGTKSADVFEKKVEKMIELISTQPLMFKALPMDETIRIGLVSKQTSLYYRVTDTTIHLLFCWDNRQQPLLLL